MRELQIAFITNSEVRRIMRILSILEREQQFTIVELSERLGISQRTMIKDIQSIKNHFGKSILLVSKYSGFYFEEQDRVTYHKKKEQLLEQEVLFEIVERIFYGERLPIDDLAHQYNYAESTLRRFFSRIQPILTSYGITVTFNPLDFQGSEANIRKFFFDFYYAGEQTPHTIRPPEGLHPMVLQELVGKLGTYELGTGTTVSAFYYHLYITMVRVQQGQLVTLPDWLREIDYQEKDFQLLYALQKRIKKEYGVFLPKKEFSWLHLSIITRRTIHRREREAVFSQRFNQWPEIEQMVASYLSNPFFDQWDTETLKIFMTSFFVSRKINDTISPALNKELVEVTTIVKKNYRNMYDEITAFLESYSHVLSFSSAYFEEIVVSFTMYMGLLLQYYQPKRQVLFLLEGDYLLVQFIRMQARQQLGETHELLFLPLQELTQERLTAQQVDLIVTNYRPYLFEYHLQADYVLMNTMPDANDWARIKYRLNPMTDYLT
ncbi:helix-turn-helix domain-containing protein [Enterococcus entomosocium]|uniref:helix-turn-helix domain-containing protein n=1 Tax=Enterococcus entomosocium TaxID=3034352 RepID=UPI003B5B8F5C